MQKQQLPVSRHLSWPGMEVAKRLEMSQGAVSKAKSTLPSDHIEVHKKPIQPHGYVALDRVPGFQSVPTE